MFLHVPQLVKPRAVSIDKRLVVDPSSIMTWIMPSARHRSSGPQRQPQIGLFSEESLAGIDDDQFRASFLSIEDIFAPRRVGCHRIGSPDDNAVGRSIIRAYLQHDGMAHGDRFGKQGGGKTNMKIDADPVRAAEGEGNERAYEGSPGSRPVNRGDAFRAVLLLYFCQILRDAVQGFIPRYALPLAAAPFPGAFEGY